MQILDWLNAAPPARFRPAARRLHRRADADLIRNRCALAALGTAGLIWATPAAADFSVCNQTLDVVNVAIGQQRGEAFRTEGWWTIGSNQCATIIRESLRTRYVYVFATDVFGQTLLDGTVNMCVGAEKFTIDNTDSCWQRGFREAQFYEVDTKGADDWRLFLSDPPDPAP